LWQRLAPLPTSQDHNNSCKFTRCVLAHIAKFYLMLCSISSECGTYDLVGNMRAIAAICTSLIVTTSSFAATTTVTGPSGRPIYTTSCKSDQQNCYQEASQYCGGPYQVLSSRSNAGGLIADWMPGPVTWYYMTYSCGRSDGRLAGFPFQGRQYQPPRPSYVNCDVYPNNVQCYGYH
jgi:hypothetical protein